MKSKKSTKTPCPKAERKQIEKVMKDQWGVLMDRLDKLETPELLEFYYKSEATSVGLDSVDKYLQNMVSGVAFSILQFRGIDPDKTEPAEKSFTA